MFAKLLIAASLLGTLAITSTPSVAQNVAGLGAGDLGEYSSGSGTEFIMNRRCNYRPYLYNPFRPNPDFLACSITAATRCRSGIIPGIGRVCLTE